MFAFIPLKWSCPSSAKRCAGCKRIVGSCCLPFTPAQVADPTKLSWWVYTKVWQQPPRRLIVLYPAAEVGKRELMNQAFPFKCNHEACRTVGCPLAFFPSRVNFSFPWVSLAALSICAAAFPPAGTKARRSPSINKWSKVTADLTEKNGNPNVLRQYLEVLSLRVLTYVSSSINLRMSKEKLTTSLMRAYP